MKDKPSNICRKVIKWKIWNQHETDYVKNCVKVPSSIVIMNEAPLCFIHNECKISCQQSYYESFLWYL
jgi:hypothetical protein